VINALLLGSGYVAPFVFAGAGKDQLNLMWLGGLTLFVLPGVLAALLVRRLLGLD